MRNRLENADGNWLRAEVLRRGRDPEDRLLVVFDLLDEVARNGFAASPLLAMLRPLSPSRELEGSVGKLCIETVAEEAGLADARTLAGIWHVLLNGAVVAVEAGDHEAPVKAQWAARQVLAAWPRQNEVP